MRKNIDQYKRVADEAGEAYYCPVAALAKTGQTINPDTCVEASTVERYSGNLNISD